jgi:hypothetical protein
MLPSDTHRKPITTITAVLFPVVTHLLTLVLLKASVGTESLDVTISQNENFVSSMTIELCAQHGGNMS